MKKITNEEKLISYIVRELAVRQNKDIKNLIDGEKIDWERVKDLLDYHGLMPFAFLSLKKCKESFPLDFFNTLSKYFYTNIVRNQRFWNEFQLILREFEACKVGVLPLKGLALLYDLYKDKPVRPMCDIDLLVKEEDLEFTKRVLANLGYQVQLYGLTEEYWRTKQCHISFEKKANPKTLVVEIHWGVDFKRKNRNLLSELWERTRVISVGGEVLKTMSPEDAFFSLALHNRRYGNTLSLKSIYDIILLLSKYGTAFNWDYFLKMCKKYELFTVSLFAFYQAEFVMKLNVPKAIMKQLKVPLWKRKLIKWFIKKNTFSKKRKIINKQLYAKSHFLLYDTMWEPISYILNIPKEQFAKFYNLYPYGSKTDFLYKNRLLYMILKVRTPKGN